MTLTRLSLAPSATQKSFSVHPDEAYKLMEPKRRRKDFCGESEINIKTFDKKPGRSRNARQNPPIKRAARWHEKMSSPTIKKKSSGLQANPVPYQTVFLSCKHSEFQFSQFYGEKRTIYLKSSTAKPKCWCYTTQPDILPIPKNKCKTRKQAHTNYIISQGIPSLPAKFKRRKHDEAMRRTTKTMRKPKIN